MVGVTYEIPSTIVAAGLVNAGLLDPKVLDEYLALHSGVMESSTK